jgi:hypothetical protein
MKIHFLVGTAVVLAVFVASAQTRHRDININVNGRAENCADLQVRSGGEIAQTAESYTLQRGEVPVLEVNAAERGAIRVRGSARADFAVDVCKIAAADDRGTAEQLLRSVTVSRLGGRFTTNSPAVRNDNSDWQVYFIVHAPSDARVNLETNNGPIEIASISGGIRAKTTNGPLALTDCSGAIDARTTNGPVSFSGAGGDVQLNTTNGPMSLRLANDVWSGPRLEAHTTNGPLSVAVPDTFQTAMRVETDGHSPIRCGISACAHALTDTSSGMKTLQLNGGSDTVRVSTVNGPVSVGSVSRTKIM